MAQEQTYSVEDAFLDITSRVRSLEGKYNLIRDRVLIINNNMIEEYKKTMAEVRVINDDIKDIKSDLFKIKESMKHVIKEMELFARKEDVTFLEKYINLWNPMKFTTEEDVIKLIESHKAPHKEEKEDHKHARKS